MNQILNDRFQPGIFAHAKEHRRALTHLDMIDRSSREQIAINLYLFDHGFTEFLFSNLLHGGSDEFQIAFISDMESNFIPDVREERPGIIEDRRIKNTRVWKFDQPSARMIG